MERSVFAIGAFALVMMASGGVRADNEDHPAPRPQWGFLGFSEEKSSATHGLFELQEACQEEFGAGARICTTAEISSASAIPEDLPEDIAWVDTRTWNAVDVGARLADCGGWSDSNGHGAVVDRLGRFTRADCTESLRVACCRIKGSR